MKSYSLPQLPQRFDESASKISNKRDAQAYGRLAASNGWHLDLDCVEPEFHDAVRASYSNRLRRPLGV